MLQRLLGEFLNVNGVDQATVIDDRGRLLSCVGGEGQLPLTQRAVEFVRLGVEAPASILPMPI